MSPTTEQQILAAVDEMRANVRVIAVKLFGTVELNQQEQDSGRLPLAEHRLNDHSDRLKQLESQAHGIGTCVVYGEVESMKEKAKWFERFAWGAVIATLGWLLKTYVLKG